MSEKPGKNLLEAMTLMMPGLSEVSRKRSDWHKQDEPAIQRFAQKALTGFEDLTLFPFWFTVICHKSGWSEMPLVSMKLSEATPLFRELAGKTEDEIQAKLDTFIPEYFRRNDHELLEKMVRSWRNSFPERMHVLEDALWAHKQEKYTLSIPSLATQVEGIIRRFIQNFDKGYRWQEEFREQCEGITERMGRPRKSERDDLEEAILYLESYCEMNLAKRLERYAEAEKVRLSLTPLRLGSFFDNRDFKDPDTSSVVNRHVICHGIFTEFGEKESLKLFFVGDLLHRVISNKAEDRVRFPSTSATLSRSSLPLRRGLS